MGSSMATCVELLVEDGFRLELVERNSLAAMVTGLGGLAAMAGPEIRASRDLFARRESSRCLVD